MNDKDRIRLAEAMGWKSKQFGSEWCYETPDGHIRAVFDPFTDANDDYAVLEWMRTQEKEMKWAFEEAYFDQTLQRDGIDVLTPRYRIGDYARAALKVLNDEN